jgi:hypothetical protein
MPMQPIHRLANLAQRPDGAVEWACPRCGRYLLRYPHTQLVLAAGASDTVHVLGDRDAASPIDLPAMSEYDRQFLHAHAMGW